jgi:hypothetical protein
MPIPVSQLNPIATVAVIIAHREALNRSSIRAL